MDEPLLSAIALQTNPIFLFLNRVRDRKQNTVVFSRKLSKTLGSSSLGFETHPWYL